MPQNEEPKAKTVYDGRAGKFDDFDKQTARWCRQHFGELHKHFWLQPFPTIDDDNVYAFANSIYKVEKKRDSREANRLWETDYFWTKRSVEEWFDEGKRLLFDEIEAQTVGNAGRLVEEYKLERIGGIRSGLMLRYGGSTSSAINDLERAYDKGLPKGDGQAFPDRCDMPGKLHKLEEVRNDLKSKCPLSLRDEYPYGKDEKLVRIILEHMHVDYQDVLDNLVGITKLKRELAGHVAPENVGIERFSDEWLPKYHDVYCKLIAKWETLRKGWKKSSGGGAGGANKPQKLTMMTMQEARKAIASWVNKCYACGKEGHKRGDPVCKAAHGATHPDAPVSGRKAPNGSGRGNGVCFGFKKGYCRYGDNCRFKHPGDARGLAGASGGAGTGNELTVAAVKALKGDLLQAVKRKRDSMAAGQHGGAKPRLAADEAGDELLSMLVGISKEDLSLIMVRTEGGARYGENDLTVDVSMVSELHPDSVMGVDTDSARSLSTNIGRFLGLDDSAEARDSVRINGVGGGTGVCGGIGPMFAPLEEKIKGEQSFLIDPDAVYIKKQSESEPSFTVLGQQRMKQHGVVLHQCWKDTEMDVLLVRKTGDTIDLTTDHGILVVRTLDACTVPTMLPNTALEIGRRIRDGELPAVLTQSDIEVVVIGIEGLPSALAAATKMVGERKAGRRRGESVKHESRLPFTSRTGTAMFVLLASAMIGSTFTSMVMNESKLLPEQRARLWHWRLGHPGGRVPIEMTKGQEPGKQWLKVTHELNEDCECCDKSGFKSGSFAKNDLAVKASNPPWWITYCDGYGGQNSLGARSYEGANGGFTFVDPATGSTQVKLKASDKQFPIALFNFLLYVESKHYHVAELWIDTYSVNMSKEAEEVAAQFGTRICPISAGTPQELAFAERSVQSIAKTSRAMLLGAPHLPSYSWALADMYATYVHDVKPQRRRGNKSPFELREKRPPPLREMFIRVFGAPVQYAPMRGPDHKRAELTHDGWFVGVQWPMVLVMRKYDRKVVSVSRKKVRAHEGLYVLPPHEARIGIDRMASIEEEAEYDEAADEAIEELPRAVRSVKSLREHKLHQWMQHREPDEDDGVVMDVDKTHPSHPLSTNQPTGGVQELVQGERSSNVPVVGGEDNTEPYIPEHVAMNDEQVLEHLVGLRTRLQEVKARPAARERVLAKLDALVDKINASKPSPIIERGHVRAGVKRKGRDEITEENILRQSDAKRTTRSDRGPNSDPDAAVGESKAVGGKYVGQACKVQMDTVETTEDGTIIGKLKPFSSDSSESDESGSSSSDSDDDEAMADGAQHTVDQSNTAGGANKYGKGPVIRSKLGTRVAAAATLFDGDIPGSYSTGKPTMLYGTMSKKAKRGMVLVKWDIDGLTTALHHSLLKTVLFEKKTSATVMAAIAEGVELQYEHSDKKLPWPKNFFEALTRTDWRQWVEAVRKEMSGWYENDAFTEVSSRVIEQGARLIPLGELFSIKRSGRAKFRQIAYGNMLRQGSDFHDTFATTVSADGLRWFCSLACACGKRIRGWDARTGYLQAKQRKPLYAYIPMHAGYSDRSMEELAVLREKLLTMLKTDGEEAFKAFVRQQKPSRRGRPERCWKLNSAVYGVPDAGQAFAMLMQAIHVKKCGMTQTDIDPSIYMRVYEDAEGKVEDYIICITWTDDVRYFGTDRAVKEYEEAVALHLKVTIEGDSDEFVSLEIKQDLEAGTLELTQKDYWVKAVERFSEYLPKGPKVRKVPLTVGDAALLTEATPEEIEAAKHLPYRELLGVLNYAFCHTKLEGRFAQSQLSRYAHGWSAEHFRIALKTLEYGWTTRDIGIIYSRDLDEHGVNTLYAYADSGFSVPRSQGCRLTMMNGAAVSCTSARHTTTDLSTTSAELTEAFLASCDVEGLRNLMAEVGCFQEEPTLLYQDCQPAISVANNRGSLAKRTRAIDIRVFGIRNIIEDQKVRTQYCNTLEMVADLGTKALDEKRFVFLRDLMNGYALVAASKGRKGLPSMVCSFS
jgi:hypothetical protein